MPHVLALSRAVDYGLPVAVLLALRAVQGASVALGAVAGWNHLLGAAGLALAIELALSARRSRIERRDD